MKTKYVCYKKIKIEFCQIPAGVFTVGQTIEERCELINTYGQETFKKRFGSELPTHNIALDKFWIAKTPGTVENYRVFLNETGWKTTAEVEGWSYHRVDNVWEKIKGLSWAIPGYSQSDQHPVVHVSWFDAVEFTKWISVVTGQQFYLPTAAEWEGAAHGGIAGCRYAGCGDIEQLAWIENNSGRAPKPVSLKISNNFGLHDMCGNVWEWCQDYYYPPTYQQVGITNDPRNHARVSKGGAWHNTKEYVRCANHHGTDPCYHGSNFGFRLCLKG